MLTVLILCISLLYIFYKYGLSKRANLLMKLPGPKDMMVIGNSYFVLKNLKPDKLFIIRRYLAKNYKLYKLWCLNVEHVNITTPEDVETVISTTKHNTKNSVYKFLKPWLQEGLLLSKDSKWHDRRKILTPTFHFNILRKFFITIEHNCQRMVNTLSEKTGDDQVDIVPILSDFTLHSICETAMGTKLSEETTSVGIMYKNAIHKLGTIIAKRLVMFYLHSDILFNLTTYAFEQRKYTAFVHNFTDIVIRRRKEEYKHNPDFDMMNQEEDSVYMKDPKKKIAMLDLLLKAEKDGEIDEKGVKEEVDTFMFEGHDTTASGLHYCIMSIANYKDIQDKIVRELHDIFGASDRAATFEDLAQMNYLENVIKETLRLYPPVHFIGRTLSEDTVLSNFTVPAGVDCNIHIFDLHRQEESFPDPLKFDPDRFLPENSAKRHPYAYIPFSAGPRNCIGQRFAMMEMKLAVSSILRKFELFPVTKAEELIFLPDMILRSGSIYVKFEKRT